MNSRPSNGVKKDRLKLEDRRREDVDKLGISLATLSRTGTLKRKEAVEGGRGTRKKDKESIRPARMMARYIYIYNIYRGGRRAREVIVPR